MNTHQRLDTYRGISFSAAPSPMHNASGDKTRNIEMSAPCRRRYDHERDTFTIYSSHYFWLGRDADDTQGKS